MCPGWYLHGAGLGRERARMGDEGAWVEQTRPQGRTRGDHPRTLSRKVNRTDSGFRDLWLLTEEGFWKIA